MQIDPQHINLLTSNYNICICEGAAERVIINRLLESGKLIISKDSLLGGEIEKIRSSKQITEKYLNKDYNKEVSILRILDSPREVFKLGKLYTERVKIFNFYTRPEIEMLIIIDKNDYQRFTQRAGGEKPSDYCKREYGMHNIKTQDFMSNYFNDIDRLTDVLRKYNSLSTSGEYNLYSLLK